LRIWVLCHTAVWPGDKLFVTVSREPRETTRLCNYGRHSSRGRLANQTGSQVPAVDGAVTPAVRQCRLAQPRREARQFRLCSPRAPLRAPANHTGSETVVSVGASRGISLRRTVERELTANVCVVSRSNLATGLCVRLLHCGQANAAWGECRQATHSTARLTQRTKRVRNEVVTRE
jgi:hypothetical protein